MPLRGAEGSAAAGGQLEAPNGFSNLELEAPNGFSKFCCQRKLARATLAAKHGSYIPAAQQQPEANESSIGCVPPEGAILEGCVSGSDAIHSPGCVPPEGAIQEGCVSMADAIHSPGCVPPEGAILTEEQAEAALHAKLRRSSAGGVLPTKALRHWITVAGQRSSRRATNAK